MTLAKKEPEYTCIRENFSFNKHFLPGDGFPDEWIEKGYKPNQHFAPTKFAHKAIEEAAIERAMYSHSDDPRSTKDLRKRLSDFSDVPPDWPRKRVWLELRRYETAEARDQKPKRKVAAKG